MWKELILQCTDGNQWVKIQPGAEEAQICAAEQTLGIRFPEQLRELYRELNGDRYFIFSLPELVETYLRTVDGLGEVYPGVDRLLYFAGNGCGDYYCYAVGDDGAADPSVIYRWEHEENRRVEVADCLETLIMRYFGDQI